MFHIAFILSLINSRRIFFFFLGVYDLEMGAN